MAAAAAAAEASSEGASRPTLAESFASNADPEPFVCTFTPHTLAQPWMSEPHPKHLVYPNVRPEWCSPSWHAKPVAAAAFIPGGRSKRRVRPLLRAILRKLGREISKRWPDAVVRIRARKGGLQYTLNLSVLNDHTFQKTSSLRERKGR